MVSTSESACKIEVSQSFTHLAQYIVAFLPKCGVVFALATLVDSKPECFLLLRKLHHKWVISEVSSSVLVVLNHTNITGCRCFYTLEYLS